ncbi:hypothetical protein [Geosporobacter ferrireducens]|uniref:Uncharacterized protein n=1 Tax=Geosporobacter ferrireducens TaxID=1424294 RepID=A0A1D8GI56_9FIRM|nr:hypothetical protein [Geosporobacter ferrireducens]AOT70588.1 hypothetical protein Gferi_14010 [Geosporobacter ferrireducens]
MSTYHGGPVTQKPISEIAKYIKNLIPANIPETYALKPMFENVASEENIRNGVIAFRDFLYLFCDRLISDGHLYVKPQKNPKNAIDYPFLYNVTDLLADIGYHSKLAESGDSLLITEIPSFTASIDEKGNIKKPKNSVSKLIECLRFLALCGFVFTGIDLEAKTLNISEVQLLEVSYPNASVLLTGLKAMSIADIELRTKRYKNDNNHDNLLRCDYRLMKAEDTDVLDVLKDFLHPLPEKVQKLALELHQRYIDMGMTCVTIISTFEVHFAYSYIKNSRRVLSSRDVYQLRVWEFALSTRYGYCLVIRAKKTDKYADVIEKFSLSLQEKIAKGYGCDRKLRNEPCQGGCQGFRIPLDGSILNISRNIETWLDNEVSC